MKKLKSIIAAAGCATMLLVSTPLSGYALTEAEIDKRLKEIQQEEARAAQRAKEAEQELKQINSQLAKEKSEMEQVLEQIDQQAEKLRQIGEEIGAKNEELAKTEQELLEAEERVASRDQLLKSRLRLLYTNGFVSYIEVLLESTSFTDFLDRYHALQAIVSQDKEILESNKKDRELIAEKKQQVEIQLAQVQTLYAEEEQIINQLIAMEKQKEVVIASLSAQSEETEGITEEQEAYLKKLAAEKSKLWAEKNRINAEKNKQAAFVHDGKFNWPLPGRTRLSSYFGTRTDPFTKQTASHNGLDIPAPAGTTIYASAAGQVIIAQYVNGYGNTVVIDHGNGLQTWYGHMINKGILVKEGQMVKAGDPIGKVGSTGRSTGNHLHFEFRKDGKAVDPLQYTKPK